MSFTIGSLFDGSGGFPLAATMCGGTPLWASEVEPFPIAVTKSRFPNMKHLGSVTDVKGDNVEPVDVITFGSPCQDLSVAGKRAGLKHEDNGDEETTRSGLFMEAVRIIKEMRKATNGLYPRFAIWENVPVAFSSNKGEDFRTVCEELIKIVEPGAVMPAVPKNGWPYADCYCGEGWSLAYRVYDAQYWGVPQRRRRIYLVVDFAGERAGKISFERDGLRGCFTQGGTPWQGVTGNAGNGTGTDDRDGEGNCLTPWDVQSRRIFTVDGPWPALYGGEGGGHGYACIPVTLEPGIAAREGGHIYEGVCGTLRANAGDNQMAVAHIVPKTFDARGNGDGEIVNIITGDHNNRITDYTSVVVEPVRCYDIGEARLRTPSEYEEKAPTLTARCGTGGNNVPAVVARAPVYCLQGNGIDRSDTAGCNGKGVKEDVCYTLNTIDRPAVVFQTYQNVMAPTVRYIVRRLTPTECARLQGFADQWAVPDRKDDFTDEEYTFWLNVRNTHAAINGKAAKDYTKEQMLSWYNKLHTDSSEYKLWGNGIALPTALYVMQGISDAINQ